VRGIRQAVITRGSVRLRPLNGIQKRAHLRPLR
jgi:hypothetical protein